MLNALRKRASSWVVKALLLLLVASFAIWGIGDVFFGNPQNAAVAEIGDSEITALELSDAFDRSLDNLGRQFGGQITREQAIGFGLMQQTLQELIGQRLIDLEARAMGLATNDETLRQLIFSDPNFQSAGRFDRLRFQQLLADNRLSEQEYLEVLRRELARSALAGAVIGPVVAPSPLAGHLHRFRDEQRSARYVLFEASKVEDVGEPSDQDLQAIYDENEVQFTAPEYRTAAYVHLTAEGLLDEIDIAPEDVQQTYDARAAQYRQPETRAIEQLLVRDEAALEKAQALVDQGKSFDDVVKELGSAASATDLGTVTLQTLPAGLGKEAFEIAQGEITPPVESPFGHHFFKVNAITPEVVTPLEEVREEIERELALAEASDRLPEVAERLDEELAAGSTVFDAASALGLPTSTATLIDRQGQTKDGKAADDLPPSPFLQSVFEAPEAEPSFLEETDEGGYFVFQVEAIEPSRLKPLDEVREEAAALWREEQQRQRARELAEQMQAQLKEDGSLGTLARDAGQTVHVFGPVKRNDPGTSAGLNAEVVAALFATEAGKTADKVVDVPAGAVVLVTDRVIDADTGAKDVIAQLEETVLSQIQGDVFEQFQQALEQRYPVEVHEAVLNNLLDSDGLLDQGGGMPMPPQGQLF